MKITAEQLRAYSPNLSPERSFLLADLMNKICPLYKINSFDIFHDFIANVVHECSHFENYTENLNYSVDALIKKFGRHRISLADANKYGRITGKQKADQQAIANTIYGGRWGRLNLGNIKPYDGWFFRGSGAIQNTGRAMFTKFCQYMGRVHNMSKTPEQMAELLRTDDFFAIHNACWVFSIEKKLNDEAERDEIARIRREINGGEFGLQEVIALTKKAEAIFK